MIQSTPVLYAISVLISLARIMLGLYISCVSPRDRTDIPPNEVFFYIFGMVSQLGL